LNIFLIGFRGTGKTTIGKIISRMLDREFIDADEYLEQKEGKTVKDIFDEGGEKLFREMESRVIAELCLLDNKIIATGGGVILREENEKKLKKNGVLILLTADVDTIYKRIYRDKFTQQKRPSLTDRNGYPEIEYLLKYRNPLYDKAADFVLNTDSMSVNDAARKIVNFIKNHVVDLKK